jgi:hypothetical protein
MLKTTDVALSKVAKALKRSLPKPGYVRNLLRRNMHIVKDVGAVFAIGTLDSSVEGGTAWGCWYHLLFLPQATSVSF